MTRRGRPPIVETPESRALRLRVLALRRKPRPTHSRGDKHTWTVEFLSLYDAKAWTAMQPPETRQEYVKAWGLTDARVSELRTYLAVHDAAVAAGANPHHLRFIPVRVVYNLRHLVTSPGRLIEELLGTPAAAERRRRVHNRSARKRYRAKKNVVAEQNVVN